MSDAKPTTFTGPAGTTRIDNAGSVRRNTSHPVVFCFPKSDTDGSVRRNGSNVSGVWNAISGYRKIVCEHYPGTVRV